MPDFVPATDDGLLAFVVPFSAKITATPVPFGVTATIATQLAGLVTTFQTDLAAAQDPATRGPQSILEKDNSREILVTYLRQVARQIQGTMTVTNDQRGELGLPLRDTVLTPIDPPSMSPSLIISKVTGNVVDVIFQDPTNPTKRGRPAGVQGISIFTHVGSEVPADIAEWNFIGSTTKMRTSIPFAADLPPGTKAFICAFFFNPRLQSGPACVPQSVIIQGGAVAQTGS